MLQTQQALYAAENALVQARLARVQAVVSLYQALGAKARGKHECTVIFSNAHSRS